MPDTGLFQLKEEILGECDRAEGGIVEHDLLLALRKSALEIEAEGNTRGRLTVDAQAEIIDRWHA